VKALKGLTVPDRTLFTGRSSFLVDYFRVQATAGMCVCVYVYVCVRVCVHVCMNVQGVRVYDTL
jgi:hypothetical protein